MVLLLRNTFNQFRFGHGSAQLLEISGYPVQTSPGILSIFKDLRLAYRVSQRHARGATPRIKAPPLSGSTPKTRVTYSPLPRRQISCSTPEAACSAAAHRRRGLPIAHPPPDWPARTALWPGRRNALRCSPAPAFSPAGVRG